MSEQINLKDLIAKLVSESARGQHGGLIDLIHSAVEPLIKNPDAIAAVHAGEALAEELFKTTAPAVAASDSAPAE